MKWRWGLAAAATLAACAGGRAFVRYPDAEAAAVKNPHEYKGKPLCQACHQGENAQLRDTPVKTCGRCHSVGHDMSHPLDTVLARREKIDLPLPDGRIVCHTCHDPHDLKRERYGLRMPLNALCLSCHKGH